MVKYDDNLLSYNELEEPWTGILVGNGASRAVSQKFAYASLYEVACSGNLEYSLTTKDQEIFRELKTRNFEQVLSLLATGKFVNAHFGMSAQLIEGAYERIRLALVHAVRSVHILWRDIPESTFEIVRKCLRTYDFVYSTNYDLLLYWAIIKEYWAFTDYFFSGAKFDPSNTKVEHNQTRICYLHGGLHLYVNQIRDTFKRVSGDLGNLLDAFGEPLQHDQAAVPLFVSEGNSADKLRSILNSTYLLHVYNVFSRHSGPLVIFGQALDKTYDGHLISTINQSGIRKLGVAIYPSAETNIPDLKAEWQQKFPNCTMVFFDSRTHPLGTQSLLPVESNGAIASPGISAQLSR